ncbi:MAG TPA: cupin domain-containing protein [Bacteroidia bacterium]|nr:cupin domain-containing protein [Bacteroidia bacterium]
MKIIRKTFQTKTYYLHDTGKFPNSTNPVLHYKNVLHIPIFMGARLVRELFRENGWFNSWKSGIFEFSHYHSITHEVLGVISGKATLLLGGENGLQVRVEKGDVLLIPAGVAHRNLSPEHSLTCIGAYPDGRDYDMNYGHEDERPQTDIRIRNVPIPSKDPVFGTEGDMHAFWLELKSAKVSPNRVFSES